MNKYNRARGLALLQKMVEEAEHKSYQLIIWTREEGVTYDEAIVPSNEMLTTKPRRSLFRIGKPMEKGE
jgi:hypothetical protein